MSSEACNASDHALQHIEQCLGTRHHLNTFMRSSSNKVFKQCSCPGIGLPDVCADEMSRDSDSLATAEAVEAVCELKTVGCKLVMALYGLTMCDMEAKSACNSM